VNILTDKRDSSYTHIPLVEADGQQWKLRVNP
jgi:hypothetical protein